MSVSYPNQYRNYCVFTNVKPKTLPEIKASLENPKSEDEVLEDLYLLNLRLDDGEKDEVAKLYPTLSRYNNTDSPNIQTFLAGIYRKTKVPDAFGPLCAMLIRNSINQAKSPDYRDNKLVASSQAHYIYPCPHFDPNEEIGGAILDYLC